MESIILIGLFMFWVICLVFWAFFAYWACNIVKAKNGHNGISIFLIIFLFGIFGFIACLLFPNKETSKKEIL